MDVTIREADTEDRATWRAYAEIWNDVTREVGGPETNQLGAELWYQARRHRRVWLAAHGERVVGACLLTVRPDKRPKVAYGTAHVLLDHRGRGVGTSLIERLEAAGREQGAVRVEGNIFRGEGDPRPAEAGERLAASRGYRLFRTDITRELALPCTLDVPMPPGYTFTVQTGPDGIADDLAMLETRMGELVPTGDVERSTRVVTAREVEEELTAPETRVWAGIARDATGAPAGFVTMGHHPRADGPERTVLHQGDTLVLPEHRGHGLGLALKCAVLAAAQADAPWLRRQRTSNTDTNVWMNRINERLGYREYGRVTNWVRPLV